MKRAVVLVPALDVYCWCEDKIGRVATLDVRAGRTWSCGHPFCVPLKGRQSAPLLRSAGFAAGRCTRLVGAA